MKYDIYNNFDNKFKELTINIQKYFDNSTDSIHKARNEIKILKFEDKSLIIKSFKIPHIINKVVYSFFRTSKAKKSYDNSIKILDFVPKPISYIEFYKFGLFQDSYFISEHFKYDFTIREPLLEDDFNNKEEVFKQFAKFTFDLHENNIFHLDYSPGNILIKEEGNKFIFKIVDINRMEFKTLDVNDRLKNFSKLWAKDDDLIIIIKEYSKLMRENEKKCLGIALKFSQEHKDKKNFKKRLKGQEVVD